MRAYTLKRPQLLAETIIRAPLIGHDVWLSEHLSSPHRYRRSAISTTDYFVIIVIKSMTDLPRLAKSFS